MSEKEISHNEGQNRNEQYSDDNGERAQRHLEKLRAAAKEAAEQSPESLDKLHDDVEAAAKKSAEINVEQLAEDNNGMTILGTHHELKNQSYKKKMKQIRSQLSTPERSFSEFIHQPLINNLSEVGSKTIFRASGILGGSITALLGSLIFIYTAKHYGFSYNYLVFFMLFAGGFVVGLLGEVLIRLYKRHPR